MNRLAGKVAVVTGGGEGIGRATCELFAEEGAAVVIAERNEATGRDAEEAIRARGGHALFVRTDVADEASVLRMADEAAREFGHVQILVNNAAIFTSKGIDASVDEWRGILDINVMGPALVSKHVVPLIKKAGGGSVVNLGSISSFIAQRDMVTYNATKAAVATMTRCMALDLARDNIRVNAVCPGVIWTQIVRQKTAEMGLTREQASVHPEWGGAQILHRLAEPREIAYPILFLASDEASFITGAQLMADGGYTAL